MRGLLISASLTGLFCSIFAVVADSILDMLTVWMLAGTAALSGFLGRIFAYLASGESK
jgi:hypothetical protein